MPGGLPGSVQALALGPHSITPPGLGLTSPSTGLAGAGEGLSPPSQPAFVLHTPGFSAMSVLISLGAVHGGRRPPREWVGQSVS